MPDAAAQPDAPVAQVDAAVPPTPDAATPPPNLHARCGWIGPGNENNGIASFVANASFFQAIHPDWWAIASDAVSLEPVGTPDDPQVLGAAAANNVKLWPLVAGVGVSGTLRTMMNNTATRSAHVQQLVQLAVNHNYAGLEIDYEGLWNNGDQAPYTAFIQELTAAMHAAGKQVSIALPPLTEDSTADAWNYAVLAQSLDVLHIMGYDFHWIGGDHAGPVAPLAWIDAVTAHAQATGHPEKFVLGLPNYGVGDGGGCAGSDCAAACGGSYATTTTHMQVCSYGNWNPGRSPNCPWGGGTLYFDDVASIEQKVMTGKSHGIGGVTYWNLGKEPAGFLTMLRRYY